MLPTDSLDVPCFECLIRKLVSWHFCNPLTCPMLDEWLNDADWRKYFKTDVPMKAMSHLSFEGQSKVSYCLECVPSSTIVYTANSVVGMGSIRNKHTVIDHKGQVRNIKDCMKRHYHGSLVKIDFAYANIPLELTPEHPLYVVKNVRKPQSEWREEGIDESLLNWIQAKDITNEDFIAFPRMREIKDIGIATEDLMELMGLYIAEGSFDRCKRGINITFSFGRHENGLITRTVNLIENLFGLKPCVTDTETQTAIRVVLSSKYFAPMFEQFGMGARNKTIPSWVMYLPENKQYRLLKGAVAGDGTKHRFSITYSTSSIKLAYRLRLLLFRLGILHGLHKRKPSDSEIEGREIKSLGYCYSLSISGDSARTLAQKIGMEYDGGEKTSGNFGYTTENYVFIPVKNVSTRPFRGYIYNVHVNETESYLTIHGAIHNCSEKHGQTAKVLLKEALQRAEADGSDSEGVVEKVRGVAEELSGFEDDTNTVDNPNVLVLNNMAREIRKAIYASKAELGEADIETLRQFKKDLDALVDKTYEVRQTEECPTCKVKVQAEAEEVKEKAPSLDEYGKRVSEKRRQFLQEIRGIVE